MATRLSRFEFKQRYTAIGQGLFIVTNEKRLPKEQGTVNLGRELSNILCDLPEQNRPDAVASGIAKLVNPYKAVTLTHSELLFTPGFNLDIVGLLLALCRNRKICIAWPGTILDGKLIYASPNNPEYYECDPRALQDTYIITE